MDLVTEAGTGRSWGVLGVPSSAAAHWPGMEKAPAVLRSAGLLERLRAAGLTVTDHGDLPVVGWASAPANGAPNNVGAARATFGRKLMLPQLISLLRVLVADRRCCAVTLVEHNPDHGAPDGLTTRALVGALADAFAQV